MKTLQELLTPRQFEVAGMVRYGLSNREIARTLGVSLSMTFAHVHRSLERTGCENRTMLAVRYALENQAAEKKPVKRAA